MSDAKASDVEANKNTKDYSELVILSSSRGGGKKIS
jgi:hypothetical protein